MSLSKSDKYHQETTESMIKGIVIPFSKIFNDYKSPDIYSGNEKIPFKERDPEYKMILRQEFANTLKTEFKIYRPIVKFPSF